MLKPLHDYLLISPDFPSDKSDSGIYIQSAQRAQPTQGYVEAIGPGKHNADGVLIPIASEIRVGLLVAFTAGSLEKQIWRDKSGQRFSAYFLKAEHVIGVAEHK